MSKPYEKVNLATGRLKIGGKEVEVKKKRKKKRKREGDADDGDAHKSGPEASGAGGENAGEAEPEVEVKPATGRIISSGMIVTGYGTKFLDELKVNDAIIITHPTTLQEETRIVKMIVSNTGMSISSGFSTDLISTTSFRYIHPPSEEVEEDPDEQVKKNKLVEENQAFGTYSSGGGSKLVYRVKKPGTYGGYRIITEDAQEGLSRTELLELRTQHKSDRHAV